MAVDTHPWISFRKAVDLTEHIAVLGGRCAAMLEEFAAHPLEPRLLSRLRTVFLSKGLGGTTAIEGNTLTVDQIRELLEDRARRLPPSRRHLQDEVMNVRDAYEYVSALVREHPERLLLPETICEIHRRICVRLDHIRAVPGRIRTGRVVVGQVYLPPEGESVLRELLVRLAAWLPRQRFARFDILDGLVRAVVAHVYLAWIHPFDDGNGRTARAVEVGLLQVAGVPFEGALLLANHYNLTRDRYVEWLRRTSQEWDGNLTRFVEYAVEALADALDEALGEIRSHVFELSWESHVYEEFRREYGDALSPSAARTRSLALALSVSKEPVLSGELRELPGMAVHYAGRSRKTLTRDINRLLDMELAERTPEGEYRACREVMHGFRLGRPLWEAQPAGDPEASVEQLELQLD